MSVIQTVDLVKKYQEFAAINSVSLEVEEGSIFGIVGANGAGKTTLINMLIGSLKPTSGSVKIFGKNPLQNKLYVRKKIGYMPQNDALYEDLTAEETLKFFGNLQKVEDLDKRIKNLVGFLDLNERMNSLVRTFSGGMKKKLSLACAMLHEPQLLFLDEPTAAIDPLLREVIWDSFRELTNRGITIFLSTHSMSEAMKCDTIAALHQGSVILNSNPKEVVKQNKKSPDETLEDIVVRIIKTGNYK